MYVTPEATVASDPNLTIHCLQKTLQNVESARGVLPPKVAIQLDNCWRENKNAYVVAYLAWLVERCIFSEIHLSCLPVGHTHNEADQCASCFSLASRNRDITCLNELVSVLEVSYHPRPEVEYVMEVANVKQMMNPNGNNPNKCYSIK